MHAAPMLGGVKTWTMVLTSLLSVVAFSSCGEGKLAKPITGPPQPGALYSLSDGEGGYRAGKVLAVEDDVVFVRYYANRWNIRPTLAIARKATNAVFAAFLSQTFAGMQPVHLDNGMVAAEESSEYEVWKRSDQDAF